MRTDRLYELENYIVARGDVSLEELQSHFDVSISTLRRDLSYLQQKGSVQKTYGGVMSAHTLSGGPLPFSTRTGINLEPKQRACELAARQVEEGDAIFVDTGTTTSHLARHLAHLHNVTVFVNNLDFIVQAMAYPNIRVFSLPGVLNRANNSFSPVDFDDFLKDYSFKKAFMASAGVSETGEVSHSDPMESTTKRTVMAKAEQRFLVIDHTKIGVSGLRNYADLGDFDTVFVDRQPDEAFMQLCEQADVAVVFE